MKIAVTGGAGFIGSRVAKKLLEKGHDVTVIDITEPAIEGVETIIADITDLEQIKSALKNIDAVYHIAGLVLDAVRKNPYNSVKVDSLGTANVLDACIENNIKKILFASTFYDYDGIDEKMIVNEETPLRTEMEFFGASKLLGELMIKEYSRKYGLEYVIFRFGSAYGSGNCTNIVRTFIEYALRNEPMEIWGEGKRRNQYTFVDDIAEGCVLGLNEDNEIFNLISPEQTSTSKLAKIMEEKYGFKFVFDSTHPEGASMPYMFSMKAMEKLGWKPTDLEEGIKKTVLEMNTEKSSKS
jgi:UDP-glucose 4-epimerase